MLRLIWACQNNNKEAVQFALERLHKEDLDPREEQLQSIKDRLNVSVCLPTGVGKSLCYQAIPFVMDFKLGRAGTGSILLSPWWLIRLRTWELKDFNHHFWAVIWPNLSLLERQACVDILLFCAPDALALLSTPCAHSFYTCTCRRIFCLICPQEHPVAGKS